MNYTLVILFSHDLRTVLLLRRNKAPYAGLLNGIGGKLQGIEMPYVGALRELEEETGITREHLDHFTHHVTMMYHKTNNSIAVFFARLAEDGPMFDKLHGKNTNEGTLLWCTVEYTQHAVSDLAGDGNVTYLVRDALAAFGSPLI